MTTVGGTADETWRGTLGATAGGTLTRFERRTLKATLAVGFWIAAAAILVAHNAPADGYEVSLYTATPTTYWLLVGGAVFGGLGVVAYAPRSRLARLGVLLCWLCVMSAVALPLLRGYYFYGLADALHHLGWTRRLAVGIRSFDSFLYPASHAFTVFVHQFTGWPIPRSSLLVVFAAFVVFTLFVPLAVGVLVDDRRAVYLGALAALLFLPVNNIGVVPLHHPFSLATLISPLLLYLLLKHVLRDAEDDRLPSSLAGTTLPLLVSSVAIVLFHPQLAVDVLAVFVTIAALQFAFRWRRPDHPISRTRPIYGQALFALGIWAAWTTNHWQLFSALENTQQALEGFVGGTSETMPGVSERGQTGQSIGLSLSELYVKLFLIETAFCVLTAGLVITRLLPGLGSRSRTVDSEVDVGVALFGVAGIVIVPLVAVQMLGEISHYFFRHLGFVLVVATILGSVALFFLLRALAARASGVPGVRIVAVGFAVLVVAGSFATVYPSPFMYKYNQHATEQQMNGYQDSYAHQPASGAVWWGAIRTTRYETALGAAEGAPWYPGNVWPFSHYSGPVPPERLADNFTGHYETHNESVARRDHYLPVTDAVEQRETVAYRGVRFTDSQFDGLDHQSQVHRVRDNGGLRLYYADVATPQAGPDAPGWNGSDGDGNNYVAPDDAGGAVESGETAEGDEPGESDEADVPGEPNGTDAGDESNETTPAVSTTATEAINLNGTAPIELPVAGSIAVLSPATTGGAGDGES